MRHENFDDFQWQAVPPAMWEMEWEVETKKKTGGTSNIPGLHELKKYVYIYSICTYIKYIVTSII